MKPFLPMLLTAICAGCAHTSAPFVQGAIRIVPPVTVEGGDPRPGTAICTLFNDGGTRWIKITDAEGKKFDVFIDHRIDVKTSGETYYVDPGAIYLLDYPGKSNSVRVINTSAFRKRIGDF